MPSHRPPSPARSADLDREAAIVDLHREIVHFAGDLERFQIGAVNLSVGGVELSSAEDRRAALMKARAGELDALEAEVTAYVQEAGKPNRKFRKMAPKAMQRLASSFVGRPVLKNHDSWDVASRAGTITESKLVRTELEGGGVRYEIKQKFSIVKPWAQEGLLDGTLDALSISWLATDLIKCSFHETEIFTKCYCWPGDRLELGGGKPEHTVEWTYDGAEGTETSFVNVPAVVEASVDRVRALALSLDSSTLAGILGGARGPIPVPEKETMDPKLLAALGLPLTATAEEAAAKAAALAGTTDELTLARTKLATFEAAETTRKAAEVAEKLAADTKRVDVAIADLAAKGKIIPGGEGETALRNIAKRDMSSFEAQVADFSKAPSVTPVGRAAAGAAPVVSNVDDALAANPTLKGYLQAAGITKDQFEKFGMARLHETQTPA
jgi:hypothetical protein